MSPITEGDVVLMLASGLTQEKIDIIKNNWAECFAIDVMKAENVEEYAKLFLYAHEIPQEPDPEWVDPQDGTPRPMIDKYTLAEWALISAVGGIRREINRGGAQKYAYKPKELFENGI